MKAVKIIWLFAHVFFSLSILVMVALFAVAGTSDHDSTKFKVCISLGFVLAILNCVGSYFIKEEIRDYCNLRKNDPSAV